VIVFLIQYLVLLWSVYFPSGRKVYVNIVGISVLQVLFLLVLSLFWRSVSVYQ